MGKLTGAHIVRANARAAHKQRIQDIKNGVSFLKSDLILTSHRMRELSAKEADRLDRIIYKLECWQNS